MNQPDPDWEYERPVASRGAAIILAGGKSTRLGRDKASEPLLGITLLQRAIDSFEGLVSEYVVVRAYGQELPPISASVNLTVVEDVYADRGPLGGIFTGLRVIAAPRAIVVACDMPLLEPALMRVLLLMSNDRKLVVPMNAGRLEPLCAVYATSCLEALRKCIEVDDLRLTRFAEANADYILQPHEWMHFDREGLSFRNLNRQLDLHNAVEVLLARKEKASGT